VTQTLGVVNEDHECGGGGERLPRTANNDLPVLLSTKRTKTELGGIGQTKLYELLANGDLVAVKIGRKTLITRQSLVEFIQTRSVAKMGRQAPK